MSKEIIAGTSKDELQTMQMELEGELSTNPNLTPRQIDRITRQLAYIAFELQEQET